jgi:hypothetical protein
MGHSLTQSPSYARSTECDERLWPNPYQTGIWLATKKVIVLIPDRFYYHVFMVLYQVMDLARAPRRTVRKKGSGYENGGGSWSNRGTSQRSVDELYLLTAPRVLNLFNTALQSQLKYIFRAHSHLPLYTSKCGNGPRPLGTDHASYVPDNLSNICHVCIMLTFSASGSTTSLLFT